MHSPLLSLFITPAPLPTFPSSHRPPPTVAPHHRSRWLQLLRFILIAQLARDNRYTCVASKHLYGNAAPAESPPTTPNHPARPPRGLRGIAIAGRMLVRSGGGWGQTPKHPSSIHRASADGLTDMIIKGRRMGVSNKSNGAGEMPMQMSQAYANEIHDGPVRFRSSFLEKKRRADNHNHAGPMIMPSTPTPSLGRPLATTATTSTTTSTTSTKTLIQRTNDSRAKCRVWRGR